MSALREINSFFHRRFLTVGTSFWFLQKFWTIILLHTYRNQQGKFSFSHMFYIFTRCQEYSFSSGFSLLPHVFKESLPFYYSNRQHVLLFDWVGMWVNFIVFLHHIFQLCCYLFRNLYCEQRNFFLFLSMILEETLWMNSYK